MSAEKIPLTGLIIGCLVGLVIGFVIDGGPWSVAAAAGCAWVCNGVSGLMKGELYSFTGKSSGHFFRDKEPMTYWIRTFLEMIIGGVVLYMFFVRER